MINKYSLIVLLFLCTFVSGFGQGSESFFYLNAASGSYSDNSYVGDNGVTWTYGQGRLVTATYNITATSIGFNSGGSKFASALSGANGVGNVTYSVRSYFTGGNASDRSMEVYVNGTLYDSYTLASMGTVYTRTLTANETGNVTIEFRSTGSRQIVLDDISWTSASGCAVASINSQPTDQSVLSPSTANFAVTANGTAPFTYQWEVSTNGGGTWNNVATGTGGTTNSYTTAATTLAMDGYQYRCVVGNACGPSVTSNVATLTVSDLADVVITEIMYNTPGGDDYEWIEICNLNGTSQDLSNYVIRVNGTVRFTFPGSTSVPANSCITILLGYLTTSPSPECPFSPNYSNPIGVTNYLPNGGGTITLLSPTSDLVDSVFYDDADSNATDGNGSSFHIVDATMDNSDTATNWTATPDGGSPGTNSIVSPCSPVESVINVEGDIGSFPDITNGDTTPSGTDNTLFASQFIGSSQEKGFRIQNLGIIDLTISNISIVGANPGDFTISIPPATTIPSGGLTTFEISFSPLASGIRRADVRIVNNDADQSPFLFRIQGTGDCVANPITISPASGPENTVVTVIGSNLNGATASFNGVAATVTPISATQMEVTVPPNAVSGNLQIVDNLGCPGAALFTVIDEKIADCQGGATLSSLFISQVTDSPRGSLTYVELYNATTGNINFATTNYSLSVYNNGITGSPTGTVLINSGTIAQNGTFVVVLGVTTTQCSVTGGDGSLAQLVSGNSSLSINFNQDNDATIGHDFIGLYNSASTLIDAYGVFGDGTWANGLGLGTAGANFERKTDVTVPSTTFLTSDWNITNWNACDDVNYNDIGAYDFSLANPPTVNTLVAPTSDCDLTALLTITGAEGSAGGNPLAYQWYSNTPGDAGWTAITNGAIYSGATTASLSISNTLNLDNYQYYCQVRENTVTCYVASNAIRLTVQKATWDGSNWSPATPDSGTIAVIAGNYNTSAGGTQVSFRACQLIVRPTYNLTIANGTYVEVQNFASIEGNIFVETHGSFVQRADLSNGFILNPGATAQVNKSTAIVNNWYDYTYWSSPVFGATVGAAIDIAPATRRFWYNAANYLDVTMETNNDNGTVPGHDDIDDNGDDWQIAPAAMIMAPGQGFAATVLNSGMFPGTRQVTFTGPYNNGTLTTPIFYNGPNGDKDWNLIGNPYPSAISFYDLYDLNSVQIDGAAYLWSQASPPDNNNNGNQNMNFNLNDYAIISRFSGNTAGGDGVLPNNFIPSGQSFFVKGLSNDNVTFNNDMRMADLTSNNQFFRTESTVEPNRLWVNLTSDNGVFNQILIAYVDGGTNGYDGMAYDADRNLSSGVASILYTMIDGVDGKKFAIQGKDPNSLTTDEIIPLGFYSSITQPTLYSLSVPQLEGEFLSTHTIYLKDNLMGTVHNLSDSAYSFTSETGEFNNRFEIVFQNQSLSVIENEITANDLAIIELNDGRIKFSVGNNLNIQSVEIFDMLGRTLYELKGDDSVEVYDLHNLSQSTYIAKVKLSNGQTITKRAVKRK